MNRFANRYIEIFTYWATVIIWAFSWFNPLCRPWKWVVEGGEEIDDRIADNDAVKSVEDKSGPNGSHAYAGQSWMDFLKHTDVATLELLTKGELKHHHWQSDEDQTQQVRNEEQPASILEALVREPPEVTQPDACTERSNDECEIVPFLAWSESPLLQLPAVRLYR